MHDFFRTQTSPEKEIVEKQDKLSQKEEPKVDIREEKESEDGVEKKKDEPKTDLENGYIKENGTEEVNGVSTETEGISSSLTLKRNLSEDTFIYLSIKKLFSFLFLCKCFWYRLILIVILKLVLFIIVIVEIIFPTEMCTDIYPTSRAIN